MKMTNLKLISIIFLGIFTFIGCGGGNTSRGTGWDINSKKGGFQYNIEFNDQETGPGLVFIEGGTFTMGGVTIQGDAPKVTVSLTEFQISEKEITNEQYVEFLNNAYLDGWIKVSFQSINDPCGSYSENSASR